MGVHIETNPAEDSVETQTTSKATVYKSDVLKKVPPSLSHHHEPHDIRREDAKRELRSALSSSGGKTDHPDVARAVDRLTELQKETSHKVPPSTSENFLGLWRQISAQEFPGPVKDTPDGSVRYTLGRISFNMFQPKRLQCSLGTVHNSVRRCKRMDEETGEIISYLSYDIRMSLTIHHPDQGELYGEMVNVAECEPASDERMTVRFHGGSLSPSGMVDDEVDHIRRWKLAFDEAYAKAEEERSFLSRYFNSLLFWLLQLTPPTDADDDLTRTFTLKRAPSAYLDILYCDDELRITKGSKGTIIVCVKDHDAEQEEG